MARRKSSVLSIIIALVVLAGIAIGLYYVTDHFTNWHLNVDCIAGNHKIDENGVCVSCNRQFATGLDLFVDGKPCDADVINNNFGAEKITYNLSGKVFPENSVQKEITWKSDNTDVAIVDNNGVVSIVGTGEAIVTASLKNGVSATCKFIIDDSGFPEYLVLEHDKMYYPKEYLESEILRKDILRIYNEGSDDYHCDLVWTSSDESVVLLYSSTNSNTHLLLCGEGTSIITVSAPNGVSARATVYVGPRLELTMPEYDPATVDVGDTFQIQNNWLPSQLVTDSIHHWASTDESVATIDSDSGLVTIVGNGQVTFRAYTSKNVVGAEITITVDLRVPETVSVLSDRFDQEASIDSSKKKLRLSTNATGADANLSPQSAQLSVSVYPASAPQTVQWTSSDSSIATVDEQGNVTAVGNGTATITATAENGVSDCCTVQVDTFVESVRINEQSTAQNPLIVSVGETLTLTATALPTNATLGNQVISWTSVDDAVATVDDSGTVTGVSDGVVEIRAYTESGITGTTTVEVCGIESILLNLTPNDNVFDLTYAAAGGELKYKYALTFDNIVPLEMSVTPSSARAEHITYTSSDPDVVSVSAGKIKGKALGKAAITATAHNGVTATMEVICTGTRGTDLFVDNLNLTLGETVSPFTDVAQQVVLEEYIRAGKVGNYEQLVGGDNWFEYILDSNYLSYNSATGDITALAAGETTLSITVYDFIWRNDMEVLTTVEIPVTISEIPATLQVASWSQIQSMAADGTLAQHFNVGDEKTVTLTDGQELTFVLLDFNHDATNSATFGLKGLYGTCAMNTANSNTANATMTAKLAEVYELLPDDLKAVIRTVDKATTAGGNSRTIKTTQEQLFLFSEIEVTGVATGTFAGEGTQYAWFVDANNRVKDGKWFLRSPAKDSYTMFRAIYETGNVGGINANVESGVCFGFCV